MSELSKEELKSLLQDFMYRWHHEKNLKWKDLLPSGKSTYLGYNISISFGKGLKLRPPKHPWIAFLKEGQSVNKGIYPLIIYKYYEKKLATFIGVSFENEPDHVSTQILSDIEKDNKYFEVNEDNLDSLINQLDQNLQYFEYLIQSSQVNKKNSNQTKTKNIILYGPP